MKYPYVQGNPNEEWDVSNQSYFENDFALKPNDSTSTPDTTAPGGSTLSVNGKFFRVRTNGNLVQWNGTTWEIVNKTNILADANTYSDTVGTNTLINANNYTDNQIDASVIALAVTVNTYADMVAYTMADLPINFLVLEDENKSQENTTYNYYPSTTPTLMWMASIKEEI